MGTEDIIIAVGGFVAGLLLLKHGGRLLRTRDLPPVSRQWLLEQRGRDGE